MPSNFQSIIINRVKNIINEILNESLNISLFFYDSSSNDIIQIPKENLTKNKTLQINSIKFIRKEKNYDLYRLDIIKFFNP